MSGERKPRMANGWISRTTANGRTATCPGRSAKANSLTIARAGSAERLQVRCPVVAHKSLTPFSNENGVTLMAIG